MGCVSGIAGMESLINESALRIEDIVSNITNIMLAPTDYSQI